MMTTKKLEEAFESIRLETLNELGTGFISDCITNAIDKRRVKYRQEAHYGEARDNFIVKRDSFYHKRSCFMAGVNYISIKPMYFGIAHEELVKKQALKLYNLLISKGLIQFVEWHGPAKSILYCNY